MNRKYYAVAYRMERITKYTFLYTLFVYVKDKQGTFY